MQEDLLKDLGVWDALEKEETKRIKVSTSRAKFGKLVTLVEGLEKNSIKQVMKELKHYLACGGTIKEKSIILQGNHAEKVKEWLVKNGYSKESIE